MIDRIVKNFQAVFVMAFLVIILGLSSYMSLPRESSPEIRRPMIFVTTVYPGVSAKDIETLLTKEIENELDGLTGLDKLTSTSVQGLSQVTAEFTADTEVEIALRRVRERVDIAKTALPEDAEEPVVKELNFSDQPILIVNISNPNGLEALDEAKDFFEDEIKAVRGVLDVSVSGQLEKEVTVELDPSLLNHYGIAVEDVNNAIRNENVTIPGGTLKSENQNFDLSVSGEIKDPTDFNYISVFKNGKHIRLNELGKVRFGYKERETFNRMNGEPSISFSIKKRSGENLLALTDSVKKLFNERTDKLPHDTKVQYSFDASEDIRAMIKDLENNIFSALILVLIVTLFFLGSRNAIFVSLGIPFSMFISFFVISALGYTLNMVVLFSLVLALGMLVDNGIVIVENIYRHSTMGASRLKAAIEGTKEVAWPIATSTLTTILAFFPIVFMPGIMGDFMKYLPITVIIVLTSSLFVALTITTVFCSKFLSIDKESIKKMTEGSGRFVQFQNVYAVWLEKAIKNKWKVLIGSFVMVFIGMTLNGAFGKEPVFFPSLDPRVAVVEIETAAGTPLESTDGIASSLETIIPEVPSSLERVQSTTGVGDRGLNSSKSKIRIGFMPFLEREIPGKEAIESFKEAFANVTGAEIKIKEQAEGPPTGHDVSYEVSGTDYTIMGDLALKILDIVEKEKDSFQDIDTDFEEARPEIQVEIDRVKAAMNGLNTRMIASSIRTALNGSKISTFRQGKKEYDIVVKFDKDFRSRLQSLNNLEVVKDEKRIAVSSLADIEFKTTVGSIKRKSRERKIEIYADFKPTTENKQEIKDRIQAEIDKINIPAGYEVGSGEGQDERDRSTNFLIQAFVIAIFLIFMVLVIQFNSVTQPIIIMVSVFLSVGGVFWGLFLTQMQFVIIMSGIGIISLAGVVVNNAIVMIDYINQLRREGMEPLQAVIEGGKTRLRPVLLTAITTIIGLLPMAFGISLDFHEMTIQTESESSTWWAPMAWAVIFGLAFATVFTLFVVPMLSYIDAIMIEKLKKKFGTSEASD